MEGTTVTQLGSHSEHIMNILLHEDEITWQSIIQKLVTTEQMDPWDIDIGVLTQRYIEMLKTLQSMDFRLSGKVILAAAILLRIKSTQLVGEDLAELSRLMASPEELDYDDDEEFYWNDTEVSESYALTADDAQQNLMPQIVPRTPQPRVRKVSVFDLLGALEKALNIRDRRINRISTQVSTQQARAPDKKVEISVIIKEVYKKIQTIFGSSKYKSITFNNLVGEEGTKEEKVYTFIPLLYLFNQRLVDLEQERNFGDIYIFKGKSREKPKRTKKIARKDYFMTKNGTALKDIEDLAIYLEKVDKRTFRYYVNTEKNDIADWVGNTLQMKKLSNKLAKTNDLHTTRALVIDAL